MRNENNLFVKNSEHFNLKDLLNILRLLTQTVYSNEIFIGIKSFLSFHHYAFTWIYILNKSSFEPKVQLCTHCNCMS